MAEPQGVGAAPHIWGRKLSAAEADAYLGGEAMNLFRQQLMLCLLERLGGELEIPVAEVDATGRLTMEMEVDHGRGLFRLKLGRKQ